MIKIRCATIAFLSLTMMSAARADITFSPSSTPNTASGFETSIDDATKSEALKIFSLKGIPGTREYLRTKLAGNTDLPHHDLLVCDWLIQSGKMPDAIPVLERLAAESPPRKDIHYSFAWIALGQGRVFDAATHVEQIQKLPFEGKWSEAYRKQFTTSVRELQAKIAERRGEWQTAFELFSALIAIKPGSISIRLGLAKSAFHTNNLELAQKNLRLLEQAQQPPVLAEIVLAQWFEEAGNLKATEEWFRKGLERGDPEPATKEFAYWLLREGRPNDVGEVLQKLPQAIQDRTDFVLLRIQSEQMSGQFSKTISVLKDLIDKEDGEYQKVAKLHLAWALSDSDSADEKAEAISIAKSLVEQVGPASPLAMATLAWAHHRNGEQDEAVQALGKIRSSNLERDVAFFVARIQEARGDKELAQAFYEAIEKSKGDFYHQTRMRKD